MSTSYSYTNLSRQEWFSTCAFDGSGSWRGLGRNLSARVFELLLVRGSGRHSPSDPVEFGRWADDTIAIVGDNDEKWLSYYETFRDLYVDLIPVIHRCDGFKGLGEAAANCHLIATRQALELESGMKARFGTNFMQRYKDLYPKLQVFELPKDLWRPSDG